MCVVRPESLLHKRWNSVCNFPNALISIRFPFNLSTSSFVISRSKLPDSDFIGTNIVTSRTMKILEGLQWCIDLRRTSVYCDKKLDQRRGGGTKRAVLPDSMLGNWHRRRRVVRILCNMYHACLNCMYSHSDCDKTLLNEIYIYIYTCIYKRSGHRRVNLFELPMFYVDVLQ